MFYAKCRCPYCEKTKRLSTDLVPLTAGVHRRFLDVACDHCKRPFQVFVRAEIDVEALSLDPINK